MIATDLRWHVVAGWCLIRLNFYFGGLDAAHIFEPSDRLRVSTIPGEGGPSKGPIPRPDEIT